jgi:5-methylcytosine-specific restriction endonuclease McrA
MRTGSSLRVPISTGLDLGLGALESAGLETPLRFEDVDREQLIDEIHHVSEIVDSVPKVFDIRKHSEMKSAWFAREFGSWNEALRQAGFDPHRNHDITNHELIDELQNVTDELGETPTVEDFSAHGKYKPSLCIYRFNSWNDALREAGIEPGKRQSIPEKELEEEFNRLMDVLGYVPSGREMTELGHFSKGVYDDRFGSWNDAVRTFGEEPRFTRSGDGDSQSYGALWEERREEIIQRDGEVCVVCEVNRDTHMEKFGRDFNVHHIIPFLEEYERTGDLEIAHRPENLVTVCVQCHASVEQRSKEYFQELVPDGVLGEADSYSEGESPNTTLDEFL